MLGKHSIFVKAFVLCLIFISVLSSCDSLGNNPNETQGTTQSTTANMSNFKMLTLEYCDLYFHFLDEMDFTDMEQCLTRFRSEEGVELRQKMTSVAKKMKTEYLIERVSVEEKMERTQFLARIENDLDDFNFLDEKTNEFSLPLDKKEKDKIWLSIRFLEKKHEQMKNNERFPELETFS